MWFATNQEPKRRAYLWTELGLNACADGLLYSAGLGVAKPDLAFYRAAETKVGTRPEQVFFIDDTRENVNRALQAGWASHHSQQGDDLEELWWRHMKMRS